MHSQYNAFQWPQSKRFYFLFLLVGIALANIGCQEKEKTIWRDPPKIPEDNKNPGEDPDGDKKPGFLRYCEAKDNSPDIAHTVSLLVELVNYDNEKDLGCDLAYRRLLLDDTTIGLQNRRITSLLPFAGISSIQTLDLSGNEISDVSALEGLESLFDVNLSDNLLTSFPDFSKSKNLVYLDISKNPIRSMGVANKKSSAIDLDLSETLIDDASSLAGTPIVHLKLNDMVNLRDFSFVADFPELVALRISGNNIDSVDFLREASRKIRLLHMRSNRIKDISPVYGLQDLMIFDARENEITNIDGLFELSNLETIAVDSNKIARITPSGDKLVPNLGNLWLSGNKNLRDFSFLSKLTSLKSLTMAHTGARNIPDLTAHLQLSEVKANSAKLTGEDVVNILRAKNLEKLDINENQISDIPMPVNLVNSSLVKLRIFEVPLKNLNFLANLPSVTEVDTLSARIEEFPKEVGVNLESLSVGLHGRFEDFRNLFELPKLKKLKIHSLGARESIDISTRNEVLEELHIGGGRLDNTLFLGFLPKLQNLSLRYLYLDFADDVSGLALRKLNYSGNCITSIKPLANNSELWDTLEELDISSNQIMNLDSLPKDKTDKLKVFKVDGNGKPKKLCEKSF